MTALTKPPEQADLEQFDRVRGRNRFLTITVVILVLALIGLGVWALWESNQAEDLSADLAAAETSVASLEADLATSQTAIAELEAAAEAETATGSLNERQQEMLEAANGYFDAFSALDGDLAASYMTDDAVVYDTTTDRTWTVADGSLQLEISNLITPMQVRTFEPVLVDNFLIVMSGETFGNPGTNHFVDVIEFTGFADIQIKRVTMFLAG